MRRGMAVARAIAVGVGCGLVLATTGAVAVAEGTATACAHAPIGYDYNGDGSADQVVGVPGDNGGRGSVEVRLDPASGTPMTQRLPADLDLAPGDRFGTATATVDYNNDACDDLLVGAPGTDTDGVADSGGVYLFTGSPSGLTYTHTITGGLPGVLQPGAEVGSVLSSGTSTMGAGVVGLGVPKYDVSGVADAGAFFTTTLAADGNPFVGAIYTQASPGFPSDAEAGDQFGAVVSARVPAQWWIGTPKEDIGTVADAGILNICSGTLHGALTCRDISQASPGVPDDIEAGDEFAAEINGGWIGVPGEDLGTVRDAGLVTTDITDAAGNWSVITQNTAGIPDTAEAGDRFGSSIEVNGPADAGMPAEVQVGAPGEDLGTGLEDAGFVVGFQVLNEGTPPFQLGQAWRVSAATVGGTNTPGARFGSTIGSIRPDELTGVRYLIYGAPGTSNNTGKVFFHDSDENQLEQWTKATGTPTPGDLYGSHL